MYQARLADLVRRDPRYTYEAYEFVFAALTHTQKLLGRLPGKNDAADAQYHVTGRELVAGIRDLALREFGFMARTVFHMWGLRGTADFGEIVFNLIDAGLMSRTSEDSRSDFHDLFDFDEALVQGFRIELDEARRTR